MKLEELPFSRRGAYLAVSPLRNEKGLFIRDVRGGDSTDSRLFQVYLDEQVLDFNDPDFKKNFTVIYQETQLKIEDHQGSFIQFIFPKEDRLRIKSRGFNVRLEAIKVRYDSLNKIDDLIYHYTSYKKEARYHLYLKDDSVLVSAPWLTVGNEYISLEFRDSELVIEDFKTVKKPSAVFSKSFEEEMMKVQGEYQRWLDDNLLAYAADYEEAVKKANYIIYSSIVRPEGNLSYESIYMSKNWMQNIWSWDNCFNAMAAAHRDHELAYGQFAAFFETQDKVSGQYPDYINDRFYSYSCVKPPIHAWAYQHMMDDYEWFAEKEQLLPIYHSIYRSTMFWIEFMSFEKGSSFYTHGNDSGWDNASIFHDGLPVIAPDLQAHLIRQLDILSKWASQLNLKEEAKQLKSYADFYFDALLRNHLDDEGFFATKALDGEKIEHRHSLILEYPIIIHYRLEDNIKKLLIDNIERKHLLEYGLATESKDSELFTGNGYWLGPIWAPSTYLFFDAIREAGYEDLAFIIAKRFMDLGMIGGMAENYNPVTGEGNDDRSFTWTSSVYLLLGDYVYEAQK